MSDGLSLFCFCPPRVEKHVLNLLQTPQGICHEDEVMVSAPPFDEVIQASIHPTQEEENVVSHFPFQVFDDALFYDSESEEIEEPLDALVPSCYNESDELIENIDEFIHVGGRKWDVIFYDGDPIYDIEDHFQLFPSQLSYEIVVDSDIWKQGDDIITDVFQTPKDDLMHILIMIFGHTLRSLMNILLSTWIYSMKKSFNHLLCSDFDEGEDMVFLETGYL
jgi:hypothetical protein